MTDEVTHDPAHDPTRDPTRDPTHDPTHDPAHDAAQEVVQALRAYHGGATELDQELAGLVGLSWSDLRCLNLLDLRGGRMTAGDLARAAHLTTGAITGVVDRLVRAGLARRLPDEGDRRRVVVELDPVYRERGRREYASIMDAERAHLDRLDPAQLQVLLDFLQAEAHWVGQQAAQLRGHRTPLP